MSTQDKDKQVVRELAKKVAEIASLPVQQQKREMWKRLNSLKQDKPMVLIYGGGIPWNEMAVGDELELKTSDPFYREQEQNLLRQLYRWKHLRCDMVIEPFIESPSVVHDTGLGLPCWYESGAYSKVAYTDEKNDIVSRHFNILINEEEDIEKIKNPIITFDAEKTESNYQRLDDIYHGILEVKKTGIANFYFWPWAYLVGWLGVQECLLDFAMRPEFIHKVVKRTVEAHLCRLDQYEKLNLLSLNNNGNYNTGNGGLAYTDELPKDGFDPNNVQLSDLWCSIAAEIFSEVSPEMHDEFALQYEIQILKRFGLNYYGCCEPLHRKIHILDKIPNLRKVSMSAWVNMDEAAANVNKKYVFSYKPASTVFLYWDADQVRTDLTNVLKKAKEHGCITEIIFNANSTVLYQPQNLWEWAKIAEEVTEQFSW